MRQGQLFFASLALNRFQSMDRDELVFPVYGNERRPIITRGSPPPLDSVGLS